MKLYTEEQVRHAIKMARSSHNIFTTPFIYDQDEVIEHLTPIELPSHEEIWNEADKEESNSKHCAFTRGARYVINKIQREQMSNNKKMSVEWLISQLQKSKDWHRVLNEVSQMNSAKVDIIEEAKQIQQEQAQDYALFIVTCIEEGLPTVTFNDWINLENNEQQ